MLEYIVIALAALAVAALTLFSGFGLGTLLMPVMALFFPIPVAIAATAVVHLANNIFKVALVGRHANWEVVIRFALPGVVMAFIGAALLELVSEGPGIFTYRIGGGAFTVEPVGLVIGGVIVAFALLEILPRFQDLGFGKKWLPLGGALSGFFGGLSGNQGALRSAFLIRAGLGKEEFVGTGTVSAIMVDMARLSVYGLALYSVQGTPLSGDVAGLIIVAMVFAFAGSFIGARMMKKVTLRSVQLLVGALLMAVGIGLMAGLV